MEQRPRYFFFLKKGGGKSPKEILSQLEAKIFRVLTKSNSNSRQAVYRYLKTNKGLVQEEQQADWKKRGPGWLGNNVGEDRRAPRGMSPRWGGGSCRGGWTGSRGLAAYCTQYRFLVWENTPCVLDVFFIF